MASDSDTNIPQAKGNNAPLAPSDYAPRQMNSAQLQRMKESRRLAETKLRHIEDTLKRLQKQQEWLRKHKELQLELQQQKAILFQCTKQQTALDKEAAMLSRHEQIEGIQKKVIRLTILEDLYEQNKSEQALLEQETERLTHKQDELVKQKRQAAEQRKLAEERFTAVQDSTFQACRTEGANESTESEIQYLREAQESIRQTAEVVAEDIQKHQKELDMITHELERHRAGRQSMEMHEPMMQHTEAILLRLDLLLESKERQAQLQAQQQEVAQKQMEENQILSKLYVQYREILSQAETLEGELQMHRNSTKRQDSYTMQERAMRLKAKGQMLLSAESLWKRISVGYNAIEESEIRLNELRLKIEHTEANIKSLEPEAGKAARLSREKEYTYLLSKGQNVVQLRAGLREGVSCSVCGATHHPYHCDTMLEQSRLISEFKTDYELLEAEARGKQKQLEEFRMELAELKGIRKAEESALEKLKARQNEDVKEWSIYASLDRSFHDCSASTNQEARQAMIRQLKENTSRDGELAKKELDTFTFHHTQIAALSEKLQQLEQKKSELNNRLEEVNTACQVVAGRVERLQTRIDKERKRYSRIYEQTDKSITLTDWLREWNESHEGLKGRIQQMTSAWITVNKQIEDETKEQAIEQAVVKGLQDRLNIITLWADALQKRTEVCQTLIEENKTDIGRLTGAEDPKALYRDYYRQMLETRTDEAKVTQEAEQILKETERTRGKSDFWCKQEQKQAETLANEHAQVDIWIHNFNAQNSPIQYAELVRMTQDEHNWHDLRTHIQATALETALSQERVNNLNSRIVHLQAEGGKASNNEEEMLTSLAIQQEKLEQQRRDIMLQMARIDLTLEDNSQTSTEL